MMSQVPKFTPLPTTKPMMIVSCMDPRVDPIKVFQLEGRPGIAHVRNAGGRVASLIPSLIVAQNLEAPFKNVGHLVILHHTDCGMCSFTEDTIRAKVKGKMGISVDHIAFNSFKAQDLEQSVKDDVELIRRSPYLSKEMEVSGWVYDLVGTKEVKQVA